MELIWQYAAVVITGAAIGGYLGVTADASSRQPASAASVMMGPSYPSLAHQKSGTGALQNSSSVPVAPFAPNSAKFEALKNQAPTPWRISGAPVANNLSAWGSWAQTQGGLLSAFSMRSLTQYLKSLPARDRAQIVSAINEHADTDLGAALYTGALLANALPRTQAERAYGEGSTDKEDMLDFGLTAPEMKSPCGACAYTSAIYAISPFMAESMVTTASTVLEKCGVLSKAEYYQLQDQEHITRAYVLAGMFYSSSKHDFNSSTGVARVCQRFDRVYFSGNPSVSDAFWESRE